MRQVCVLFKENVIWSLIHHGDLVIGLMKTEKSSENLLYKKIILKGYIRYVLMDYILKDDEIVGKALMNYI